MIDAYFDEQLFEGENYTTKPFVKGEYDNCTFKECDFTGIHLSNISFIECEFINCNFSNTIVAHTAFKEVNFVECKILGVKFNTCDPFLFAVGFKDCQLSFSSFYQLKIQNTKFVNCTLQEVDFTETNLAKTLFDNCDLKNAVFEKTNLENANFITAFNFNINPSENSVKKAKFDKNNLIGLLSSFQIEVE